MKINKILLLAGLIVAAMALESQGARAQSSDWKGCKQILAGSLLLSLGFKISDRGHTLLACLPIYGAIVFITKGLGNLLDANDEPMIISTKQKDLIFRLTQEKLDHKITSNDYEVGLKRILNHEINNQVDLELYLYRDLYKVFQY